MISIYGVVWYSGAPFSTHEVFQDKVVPGHSFSRRTDWMPNKVPHLSHACGFYRRSADREPAPAPGSVAFSERDGVGREHCPLVGILLRAKGISRCRAVDRVASEAAARVAVGS